MCCGRFLRLLPEPGGCIGESGADGSGAWRESSGGEERGAAWRRRAGVKQLDGGMLSLEEGFHRAHVVGNLDILRASDAAEGVVMGKEETWRACASRDAQFPFLLAAYQHFVRAGWRVSSGLKYGATYLLYANAGDVQGKHNIPRPNGADDAARRDSADSMPPQHGHAPFAVCVLPPTRSCSGTHCPTKRKREHGEEAEQCEGKRQERTTADGSEATEDWTTIQSFTRLAAHVSKKFIIAYASYSSGPGGGDGGGGGTQERARGIVDLKDMDRVRIREFHVNRWLPAVATASSGRGGGGRGGGGGEE